MIHSETKNEHIDRLKSLDFLKSGLSKVKKILQSFGDPQNDLQIIHIAGTNGKGSVANMIAQVLYKQCHKKVGLFSSPHLLTVNERIKINGGNISDEDMNTFLGHVFQKQSELNVEVSYFEAVFIASILYFKSLKVDYAVIEVGLGGTLDATNVFSKPLCTVITHIGYDHTHILGKTKSQIQRNKMGIMKKGVSCHTTVNNKLMKYAAEMKGAKLYICNKKKNTNLLGDHQKNNAGLANQVLEELGVESKKIDNGLNQIVHRGRCEWIVENILIDGSHNQSGVDCFRKYVDNQKQGFKKLITVFGTVKKQEFYIKYLKKNLIQGDFNYFYQIDSKRAPKIHNLEAPFKVKYINNLGSFLLQAKQDTESLYVIYGSLYLMGEIIGLTKNYSLPTTL